MGGALIIFKLYESFLWHIFIWIAGKLFKYADVYSPNKDIVIGVSFSNDEKYIKRIMDIENVEWTDEEVDFLIKGLKQKIAEKEAKKN